ncbi:MAG TPA: hypothetical protein VFN37_03640 [Candidatus Baltobacteraceae bacterium]|nr:hypothetical protein [Candidatus Baltobacteraceae bacterium]
MMTHIFERVAVRCPYAAARRYVHDDAVHAVPPIPPFTLQLEHADDPLRFDERLRVQWTPKPGAPYPEFIGQIILRADPDAGTVLELTGDYLPPFGAPGRAFDLFIGTKIATATAKSVLRKMAEAIEHAS